MKASIPDKWQQNILAEPAEIALANELDEKLPKLDILLNEQNYMGAMEAINSFVPGLNNFFEKTMVMAEDISIRNNRMALLDALGKAFAKIAHISSMQI